MKVFLCLLLFYCLLSSTLHAQEREKKTVLVLYSFGQSYPAINQWDGGIRSELNAQQDINITINTEHLDLSRYNDPDYIKKVVDIFNYKYNDDPPDLIITVLEPALDLILRHRNVLFPEIPIIFGGIEKSSLDNLNLDNRIKGVYQGLDLAFKKTIDIALEQHPNTQNAVIISGVGKLETSWLNSAVGVFEQYQDKLNFSYLKGLPLKDLENEVEAISDNSLIFYFPVLEDKEGSYYISADVSPKICERANVPVYSFWERILGDGIVGGYLIDFSNQGMNVAKVALDVLSGNPIEEVQSGYGEEQKYIFDDRQLVRWSIPKASLPTNSETRFVEITFWDKYLYRILLITGVFVILLVIIGYLMAQRRNLRQSQKKLSQAQRKYQTVADYTSDWEYWQNSDGSMAWVSPSCESICGYASQMIMESPQLIADIIKAEDKHIWANHVCKNSTSKKKEGIRYRIQTKSGEIRWIEHTCQLVMDQHGGNLGVRASNRDITENEKYRAQTSKMQSELIHVERLATISTLTFTLAHEINQPLTSMRSYAQAALRYMQKETNEKEKVEKALQGIVSDNKRAAAVVNQLRGLVKKETVEYQLVDINKIIKDVLTLLKSEILVRNTEVSLTLDRGIANIQGDPVQLQQVFLNLFTNGIDAMDTLIGKKKLLSISTSEKKSDGIYVTITDTGEGIPKDKLEDIFEAFHTSKTNGIGLGLPISKSIIENHGGKIWAEGDAHNGAVFIVFLPTNNFH